MRSPMLALILMTGLAACSDAEQSDRVAGALATLPAETEDEIRVHFSCDDGQDLEMRFFPMQDLAVMIRNGTAIELPQQISASGFIYSNGPNTVRGKGNELVVEIGRRAPINCVALPDDGA